MLPQRRYVQLKRLILKINQDPKQKNRGEFDFTRKMSNKWLVLKLKNTRYGEHGIT